MNVFLKKGISAAMLGLCAVGSLPLKAALDEKVQNIVKAAEENPFVAKQIKFLRDTQKHMSQDMDTLLGTIKDWHLSPENKKQAIDRLDREIALFNAVDFSKFSNQVPGGYSLKDGKWTPGTSDPKPKAGQQANLEAAKTIIETYFDEIVQGELKSVSYKAEDLIVLDGKDTTILGRDELAPWRVALLTLCAVGKGVERLEDLDILGEKKTWFNASPTASVIPVDSELIAMSSPLEKLLNNSMFTVQKERLALKKGIQENPYCWGLLNCNQNLYGGGRHEWYPGVPVNPYVHDSGSYIGTVYLNYPWISGAMLQNYAQGKPVIGENFSGLDTLFASKLRVLKGEEPRPGDILLRVGAGISSGIVLGEDPDQGIVTLGYFANPGVFRGSGVRCNGVAPVGESRNFFRPVENASMNPQEESKQEESKSADKDSWQIHSISSKKGSSGSSFEIINK